MAGVRWDSWAVVQEAISQNRGGNGQAPMVAIMFAQAWNPPALNAAESCESIRAQGGVGGVELYVVDKDQHLQQALEYGVVACPSLIMFWKGEVMTVRRCFQADANKFAGSVKLETWQAILKEGVEAGKRYDSGESFLRVALEH